MSSTDHAPRLGAVGAVAAGAAFVALLTWTASPYGRYLRHDYQPNGLDEQAVTLVLFVAGWLLMCAAMMLPTSMALFKTFGLVVRSRPERRRLHALVLGGYLATWVAVGYAFRVFDVGLHAFVDAFPWLAERPQLIGGAA